MSQFYSDINTNKCIFSALSVIQLDVTGFNVMKKFIYAVETRGSELIYVVVILTKLRSLKKFKKLKCKYTFLLSFFSLSVFCLQALMSRACTE